MERRTFLLGLVGGLAAAAAGVKTAEAAPAPIEALPQAPETVEIASDDKAALDAADKEFSQYYVVRRRYARPRRVVYYRPVRRRVVYYRRPVRRVYYRRPARRVYFRAF